MARRCSSFTCCYTCWGLYWNGASMAAPYGWITHECSRFIRGLLVLVSVMTSGEGSPTRIAAQVVSGIGFLGGGVIIRDGFSIRGLNTAATLWCAAAVGTLVGAGFLKVGIIGAFGVILENILLRSVARNWSKRIV